MKHALLAALLAALWMTQAQADPPDEDTAPDCAAQADARQLAPAARKKFLKTCEGRGQTAASAHLSQREKMKKCNVEARGMKGDERRHFMSGCLSGKNSG